MGLTRRSNYFADFEGTLRDVVAATTASDEAPCWEEEKMQMSRERFRAAQSRVTPCDTFDPHTVIMFEADSMMLEDTNPYDQLPANEQGAINAAMQKTILPFCRRVESDD